MGIVEWLGNARARRADAAAERTYRAETARWQPDDARLAELIDAAQTFGTEAVPAPAGCPLALRDDETAFTWLETVSLVETDLTQDDPRVAPSAISFHLLRNVNWRVGARRTPIEPVAEPPVVVDAGSVTITNRRIVFQGSKHVRVWTLSKLIGIYDDATTPWTAIAVSNYERVTGLLYTVDQAEDFRFRVHLAIADQQGTRDELVAVLEHERERHEAARPIPPVPGSTRPIGAPASGSTPWRGWIPIAFPAVGLALLSLFVVATRGHEPALSLAAPRAPTSLAPTTTPLPGVTSPTTARRAAAKRSTKPRVTAPPATGSPTTAARVAAARRRATAAVEAVSSSPPATRPPAPPSSAPPRSSPPRTSPPTTPPTSPPTTSPPTTTPPTTTPTTQPTVREGAPCSPVGALGVAPDGTPMICTGTGLAGLTGPYRWQVLVS